MSRLNWRTMRGDRHPQFMVRGAELACARYGQYGRFQIVEYRVYTTGEFGGADRRIRVRDAHKISDAQIRAGGRSPIVLDVETEAEALAWCDAQPY